MKHFLILTLAACPALSGAAPTEEIPASVLQDARAANEFLGPASSSPGFPDPFFDERLGSHPNLPPILRPSPPPTPGLPTLGLSVPKVKRDMKSQPDAASTDCARIEGSVDDYPQLRPVRVEIPDSNSLENVSADVLFILRGFAGKPKFADSDAFNEEARRVMSVLSELSFGKVRKYIIWDAGVDNRSINPLAYGIDTELFTSAINDWKTDWKYAYHPDIKLTTEEKKGLNGTLFSMRAHGEVGFDSLAKLLAKYRQETAMKGFFEKYIDPFRELASYGSIALPLLYETTLPEGYQQGNYQATVVIFNTAEERQAALSGSYGLGTIQTHQGDSVTIDLSYSSYLPHHANDTGTRISIHGAIHALGMKTHDNRNASDDQKDLYGWYSVMKDVTGTPKPSLDTLPVFNRYWSMNWVYKENVVTNNPYELCDTYKALNPDAPYMLDLGKYYQDSTMEEHYMELVNGHCVKYTHDGHIEEVSPELYWLAGGTTRFLKMTEKDEETCNLLKQ